MTLPKITGTLYVAGDAVEEIDFSIYRWPKVIAATFYFKSSYMIGDCDEVAIRLASGEVLPIQIVLQRNGDCRAEWIGVQVQGEQAKDFWYRLAA